MGLLIEGQPLKWEQMKKYRSYIKKHGAIQFLNIWKRYKDRSQDKFYWGDEVEALVVSMDHEKRSTSISLRAHEILEDLHKLQQVLSEVEPEKPL